jgi:hypothetical protein
MKQIVLLLIVVVSLAFATAAVAGDSLPPGWISSPPPGNISSQDPGASGIANPTAVSQLPRFQVLNYGGCAINVNWHTAGNMAAFRATPYGSCNSQHLEKTLAWHFVVHQQAGYVSSSYGFGFSVMTLSSVRGVYLRYTTVTGRQLSCAVRVASRSGSATCR